MVSVAYVVFCTLTTLPGLPPPKYAAVELPTAAIRPRACGKSALGTLAVVSFEYVVLSTIDEFGPG